MQMIKCAKENTHPLAVLTSSQKLFTTTITGLVCRLFWFLFQTVLQMCWDTVTNDRAKRSCPSNCRHRGRTKPSTRHGPTEPFHFFPSLCLLLVTLTLSRHSHSHSLCSESTRSCGEKSSGQPTKLLKRPPYPSPQLILGLSLSLSLSLCSGLAVFLAVTTDHRGRHCQFL